MCSNQNCITSINKSNNKNIDSNYGYGRADQEKTDHIVSFTSADSAWRNEIKTDRDETFDVGYRSDGDLGDFLSRPIKIAAYQWQVGTAFSQTLDPWSAFINNVNVLRRMENYHLFRGDLDIKIMINGNGFYYGRMLVDYRPLPDDRPFDAPMTDSSLYLVQATQRPHLFIDPTTSTGGEFLLPYFYPKNWIELPTGEYNRLGRLNFTVPQLLQHSNGTTGELTISVFASMRNVQLTIPTVNPIGSISPQSGASPVPENVSGRFRCFIVSQCCRNSAAVEEEEQLRHVRLAKEMLQDMEQDAPSDEDRSVATDKAIKPESGKGKSKTTSGKNGSKDEYGDGIVSKPASIMAKMAGSITDVPYIGKYALASKMALTGIANIARIFGYSRPPVIDNIQPRKLQSSGYNAYTDMDEVVAKLTLDTKQELSIDPSTVGLEGTDQMSLAHVLRKEAWFNSFEWTINDNPENVLFSSNVTPMIWRSAGSPMRWAMTPTCFASSPFKHWRGSITFRFQIVASAFHKGRLRLTYDPIATGLFSSEDYNVAYNRIIDLAEERDFEVTVRWAQARAWAETLTVYSTDPTTVYSNGSVTPLAERSNGMIQLSVLNELTVPNPAQASPIEINCFMRAGDDFELANPDSEQLISFSYFSPENTPDGLRLDGFSEEGVRTLVDIKPEAGEECNEATDTGMSDEKDNSPVVVDEINPVGGEVIPVTDASLHVFFGEKVCSIRQLLKRYTTHQFLIFNRNTTTTGLYKRVLLNVPEQRGYALNSKTTDGTAPYNYTMMNFMNYFMPAYAGWRGGIRRKVTMAGGGYNQLAAVSRTTRVGFASEQPASFVQFGNLFPYEPILGQLCNTSDDGVGGRYQTDTNTNPTLEYELPFYSEYRFGHTQLFNDKKVLDYKPTSYLHEVTLATMEGTPQTWSTVQVAAGEDFSLFWFLNVPTMYAYPNPTYSAPVRA